MKLILSTEDQKWEWISDDPLHSLWAISNRINALKVPRPGQPRGNFHDKRFGISYMLEIGTSFDDCISKLKEHGFTVTLVDEG